jgi:hypothetical protein
MIMMMRDDHDDDDGEMIQKVSLKRERESKSLEKLWKDGVLNDDGVRDT